jgi:hypothetical protein
MYVLSSLPPSQQSIAGSIIQTITKLCVAVAYGVSTAIFNAVSASPAKTGYYANDTAQPYAATFWLGFALGAIGVAMVPFLTIRTQGHRGDNTPAVVAADPVTVGAEVRVPEKDKSIEAEILQDKP